MVECVGFRKMYVKLLGPVSLTSPRIYHFSTHRISGSFKLIDPPNVYVGIILN